MNKNQTNCMPYLEVSLTIIHIEIMMKRVKNLNVNQNLEEDQLHKIIKGLIGFFFEHHVQM